MIEILITKLGGGSGQPLSATEDLQEKD